MKNKSETNIPQPIAMHLNLNKTEKWGLNIQINYLPNELTGHPTDIPESIDIQLTGSNQIAPTMTVRQNRILEQDFDILPDNIHKLNQQIDKLIQQTIIKQRLSNCID